eukprot:TRINITY_DN108013_c0_g1_i1.p1 TRINITY_DN108013_c0_g1~~TRINITY_DN108013_c0_g1_i1.p1  ORF type:complete len:913 (+),score=209.34 TRINITY_DN108013_c0_g1_i1:126-2864(+)
MTTSCQGPGARVPTPAHARMIGHRRGAPPPLPALPKMLPSAEPSGSSRGLQASATDGMALMPNFALEDGRNVLNGIGALKRSHAGAVSPSIFEAANERKQRSCDAVAVGEPTDALREVECSELCCEGRLCVQQWALGVISGRQCVLRLELCRSASQLMQHAPSRGAWQKAAAASGEAALWVVGCMRPGAAEQNLGRLRLDLEEKTPSEMLLQAWEALERECGTNAGRLDLDEINLALRRLSVKKGIASVGGVPSNPSAFLRVQIWRELIRIHLGVVDKDETAKSCSAVGKESNDQSLLRWLRCTDQELRESAGALALTQLAQEAERLKGHAARTALMEQKLRTALQLWRKFDPWKILGVSKDASVGEVRRAFFAKALHLHPDKGGDKTKFQELQRAYDEVLAELGAQRSQSADDDDDECEKPGKEENAKREEQRKPESHNEKRESEDKDAAADKRSQSEEFARCTGTKWLELLAAKASAAAEASSERASGALRNCHAALEALAQLAPDFLRASANAESALRMARKSAQATELVERYAIQAAEALDVRRGALCDSLEMSSCAFACELQRLWGTAKSVSSAARGCLAVVSHAAKILGELQWSGPGASASQMALREVMISLAESCKGAAVAAMDAADALSKTIPAIQKQCEEKGAAKEDEGEEPSHKAEKDDKSTGESAADIDVKEDTDEVAHDKSKDGSEEQDRPKTAEREQVPQTRSECLHAIDEMLKARKLLHRSNNDLLDLQCAGRKLAVQDAFALPAVPVECREQTFKLLAEFLDEAALSFHKALKAQGPESENWIQNAVRESFGFWLGSTPELAVPVDAKSQVLRAAIALDAAAVRDMVRSQVSKRIEGIVSLVLLEARKLKGKGDVESSIKLENYGADGIHVLEGARTVLVEALTRLESGPSRAAAAA